MTVKAYVLIETQVGKTKQVVEAIGRLQGVVSVNAVTGPLGRYCYNTGRDSE